MRKEVELWWKQALKDLEAAEKNYKIGEYYIVAFLCQQSIEKALKALYIHILKESPGTTHSLVFLGKRLEVPKDLMSILRKVSPDFIITRYPDVAGDAPYELYDEEIARERLEWARRMIAWIKEKLK